MHNLIMVVSNFGVDSPIFAALQHLILRRWNLPSELRQTVSSTTVCAAELLC